MESRPQGDEAGQGASAAAEIQEVDSTIGQQEPPDIPQQEAAGGAQALDPHEGPLAVSEINAILMWPREVPQGAIKMCPLSEFQKSKSQSDPTSTKNSPRNWMKMLRDSLSGVLARVEMFTHQHHICIPQDMLMSLYAVQSKKLLRKLFRTYLKTKFIVHI